MIDLIAIRARDADYNDVFEAQASMSKDIAHRLVAWPVHDRRALLAYVDALAAAARKEAERALIIQRAENAEAALVAEVAKNGRHAMRVTIAQLEARLAEVEALRKDAERYRWLRDSAGNDIMEKLMAECSPPRWDELVDAAIDAAMGERP